MLGDARREDVLKQAEVERADKVIVATNSDDTTRPDHLVGQSAEQAQASLVAAARSPGNADLLRASGATSGGADRGVSRSTAGLASAAPRQAV